MTHARCLLVASLAVVLLHLPPVPDAARAARSALGAFVPAGSEVWETGGRGDAVREWCAQIIAASPCRRVPRGAIAVASPKAARDGAGLALSERDEGGPSGGLVPRWPDAGGPPGLPALRWPDGDVVDAPQRFEALVASFGERSAGTSQTP